ncbi:M1 family metallopeptidase [Flavilitoribacter nigricans]|nr:M1 family metallopeptidase [Flavilitoribacter nigricans]
MKHPFFILVFFLLTGPIGLYAQVPILDSGGDIMPEQAAYDVHFYELDLNIDPEAKSIDGNVLIRAAVVHPLTYFVLDLDTLLGIERVEEKIDGQWLERRLSRDEGKVWIDLEHTRQPEEALEMRVHYGGQPRVAPNPPWNGGFTWEQTSSGAHWIATTCQTNGADLWWPCKDHVSDEPDSVAIHIRVPKPLVVATNGRLQSVDEADEHRTYHWLVSTPINIYNVALNIAPYVVIKGEMESSVADAPYPVEFYVLPEDEAKGRELFPEIMEHLDFFERFLGPYPFRADKYGVAQTPHLGMEHQTIIAYGANFSNGSMTGGKDWGFDALHHHELAHEWWGNLVTNFDWRDMWLHEGFGSYMQALYIEELSGMEAYREYMGRARFFRNTLAVAPRASRSAAEIYRAPIYTKGAWILHTLRYVLGDEAFFQALRRMAYPDPALEKITDGSQTRFAATEDFLSICESVSGRELDWFFDLYLRQPALPVLHSRIEGNEWQLSWETPDGLPFSMPIEIKMDGKTVKKDIPAEGLTLKIKKGDQPEVDPDGWILMEVK